MKESSGLGLNWESMADPDTTLVIYMGVANVFQISERLIAAGLCADTPAAVINHGTRKNQKVLTFVLSKLLFSLINFYNFYFLKTYSLK